MPVALLTYDYDRHESCVSCKVSSAPEAGQLKLENNFMFVTYQAKNIDHAVLEHCLYECFVDTVLESQIAIAIHSNDMEDSGPLIFAAELEATETLLPRCENAFKFGEHLSAEYEGLVRLYRESIQNLQTLAIDAEEFCLYGVDVIRFMFRNQLTHGHEPTDISFPELIKLTETLASRQLIDSFLQLVQDFSAAKISISDISTIIAVASVSELTTLEENLQMVSETEKIATTQLTKLL